jgi:hypothetical protein
MRLKVPLVIRFHGVILISVIWKTQKKNFWFESQAVKERKHLCSNRLWGKVSKELFSIQNKIQTIHYGLA